MYWLIIILGILRKLMYIASLIKISPICVPLPLSAIFHSSSLHLFPLRNNGFMTRHSTIRSTLMVVSDSIYDCSPLSPKVGQFIDTVFGTLLSPCPYVTEF